MMANETMATRIETKSYIVRWTKMMFCHRKPSCTLFNKLRSINKSVGKIEGCDRGAFESWDCEKGIVVLGDGNFPPLRLAWASNALQCFGLGKYLPKFAPSTPNNVSSGEGRNSIPNAELICCVEFTGKS